MNTEINKAKAILAKEAGNQAPLILKEIEEEFTEEDDLSLAKLNSFYEKGSLTGTEYVTKITVILSQRQMEKRNRE